MIDIDNEITYLSEFLLESRITTFNSILDKRTDYMTVCLENIYQPHNANAVIRSCDAFGVASLHALESNNEFKIDDQISLGSEKWVDIHKETSLSKIEYIDSIRNKGYKIVATSLSENSHTVSTFPITDAPFAIFFGTEKLGLSQEVLSNADYHLHINMYGFVESLNISVSVGILLSELSSRLRESNAPWQLTDKRRKELLHRWMLRSIKDSNIIISKFRNANA